VKLATHERRREIRPAVYGRTQVVIEDFFAVDPLGQGGVFVA
jgi:hypothetical protein